MQPSSLHVCLLQYHVARIVEWHGGINAEWIWDLTDSNKKIKVLVFDDKDRSSIPANSK